MEAYVSVAEIGGITSWQIASHRRRGCLWAMERIREIDSHLNMRLG